MKTNISHSLEDTETIAREWLKVVAEKATNDSSAAEATVVGLSGHLGAGKTAFVKIVAKLLGVSEVVTSPTFVLMKIYGIGQNVQCPMFNVQCPWTQLVHIDAYRLERPGEMEALNFEQLVADPHNLIMVEWPENVSLEKIIPTHQKIRFEVVDGEYRISVG